MRWQDLVEFRRLAAQQCTFLCTSIIVLSRKWTSIQSHHDTFRFPWMCFQKGLEFPSGWSSVYFSLWWLSQSETSTPSPQPSNTTRDWTSVSLSISIFIFKRDSWIILHQCNAIPKKFSWVFVPTCYEMTQWWHKVTTPQVTLSVWHLVGWRQ